LDYPAKESHWEGYRKIKDYLEHCGNLNFKKLIIEYRDHNCGFGPQGNSALLQKEIFKHYDRYITSEDDNEFSSNFLQYMNKGLELFKDDDKIFAICGFSHDYNLGDYEYNYYVFSGSCSWGLGFWKNKFLEYKKFCATNPPRTLLLSKKTYKTFNNDLRAINALLIMNRKRVVWGDFYMNIYCKLKGMHIVFPTIRKVRNWGNDGSGAQCVKIKNDVFCSMPIDEANTFEYDNIKDVMSKKEYIKLCLSQYMKISKRTYLKMLCNAVIFILLLFVDCFDKKQKDS